jgi:hypothetical protein
MRKATVAWLAAAGVLLLFALATLSLPSLFGVVGKRALILRLALVLFGLAATVLTLVLALRRARNEPPPAAEGEDDIDLAFAGAQGSAPRLACGGGLADCAHAARAGARTNGHDEKLDRDEFRNRRGAVARRSIPR